MLTTDNAMLMVLTAPNGALNSRWVLSQRSYTLGRQSSCDICLPSRLVSRKHARLFHTNGGFFVEDLGSKNGTYINGQPITQAKPLCDGDVLQIGLAYRLSFIGKEETAPVGDKQEPTLQLDPQQKEVRVCAQLVDPPLALTQFYLLKLLLDAQVYLV
ncbi:MAG: FHA domain-containing protein [Ardenticatenaceae bacterium]